MSKQEFETRLEGWVSTYRNVCAYLIDGKYIKARTKPEKRSLRKVAERFRKEGGKVYYCKHNKNGEGKLVTVVTSTSKCREIFAEFHVSASGAHRGINRTVSALSERYYWPGLSYDIQDWIQACGRCHQGHPLEASSVAAKYNPIRVTGPWEMLCIDLLGPLTTTKSGHAYLLTAIDYYSKWVEAFPIRDTLVKSVVDCLVQMFYRHGCSKTTITDQDDEFVKEVNAGFCKALGVSDKIAIAHHPQASELDKDTTMNVKRALETLVRERGDEWDVHLEATLFSLRTSKQQSTNYSPIQLLYHREAMLPTQLSKPAEFLLELPSDADIVVSHLSAEEERERVRANALHSAASRRSTSRERRGAGGKRRRRCGDAHGDVHSGGGDDVGITRVKLEPPQLDSMDARIDDDGDESHETEEFRRAGDIFRTFGDRMSAESNDQLTAASDPPTLATNGKRAPGFCDRAKVECSRHPTPQTSLSQATAGSSGQVTLVSRSQPKGASGQLSSLASNGQVSIMTCSQPVVCNGQLALMSRTQPTSTPSGQVALTTSRGHSNLASSGQPVTVSDSQPAQAYVLCFVKLRPDAT